MINKKSAILKLLTSEDKKNILLSCKLIANLSDPDLVGFILQAKKVLLTDNDKFYTRLFNFKYLKDGHMVSDVLDIRDCRQRGVKMRYTHYCYDQIGDIKKLKRSFRYQGIESKLDPIKTLFKKISEHL